MATNSPPFPSPILPYHSKPYGAIDPSRAELSTKGKTVLITGGGIGIGKATALAFAQAGASHIGIIGRRANVLDSTKQEIESLYPNTKVHALPGDLAKTESITSAVTSFGEALNGKIDILIASAGYLHNFATFADTDPADFWYTFEANVRGSFDLLKAFAPLAAKDAVVVNVSSAASYFPYLPNYMPYTSSKLAAVKVFDYFAVENPGLRMIHLQPGVVETEMGQKSAKAGVSFPFDDVNLPAHFTVWLASPEAAFLDKRFVWANWDVDGLKAKEEEIKMDPLMFTVYLNGFPGLA
ncbi:oxidoreductase-like protein 1 [Rhypophila decipiens]|uniref:Oxidoreductase-like protein 1 n=1 Tax=Rhypophila decipiens TaxID=261697 RepID=A0AAN6YN72_9PEZI|nr:oxidoreductase-like protein 1 [Rhypophila decipiens]